MIPTTPAIAADLSAAAVIALLGLQPHPEGGHYRESFRAPAAPGERSACTSIYFLLAADEFSHWHRVKDAAEIWCYHAGAPLSLSVSENGHDVWSVRLGPALAAGQRPQAVVPAGAWQTAVSLGGWSLVGCIVAPAFDFAAFELAPPDWRPTPRGGR